MEVSDIKFFEEQLQKQCDYQKELYRELENKYNMLARQYKRLQEKYQELINKTEESDLLENLEL